MLWWFRCIYIAIHSSNVEWKTCYHIYGSTIHWKKKLKERMSAGHHEWYSNTIWKKLSELAKHKRKIGNSESLSQQVWHGSRSLNMPQVTWWDTLEAYTLYISLVLYCILYYINLLLYCSLREPCWEKLAFINSLY